MREYSLDSVGLAAVSAGIFRNYGCRPISYTAICECDSLWGEIGQGIIPFVFVKGLASPRLDFVLAIGDPIADRSKWQSITTSFENAYGRIAFVQVSSCFSEVLSERGFSINPLGVESRVRLKEFSTIGSSRRRLRRSIKNAEKRGVRVFEAPIETIDNNVRDKLNHEWLSTHRRRELRILTRPIERHSIPGVRYFWGSGSQEVMSMVTFDPIFRDGALVGYYQNHLRYGSATPWGATDAITAKAIDVFRSEGIQFLSFGLSLLHWSEERRFDVNHNTLTTLFLRLAKRLEFMYRFNGTRLYKEKYGVDDEPVYFASNFGNGLLGVFAALRSIGAFGSQ